MQHRAVLAPALILAAIATLSACASAPTTAPRPAVAKPGPAKPPGVTDGVPVGGRRVGGPLELPARGSPGAQPPCNRDCRCRRTLAGTRSGDRAGCPGP